MGLCCKTCALLTAFTTIFFANDETFSLSRLHPLVLIIPCNRIVGAITVQTFLYYHRFPKDHISLKFIVGFLW
ncbi:uncharacterized protein EI90DRAFT_3089619 [Cantharellus anzutake]|uniref:uncharacterized protein n=1 Tax=Cantharellus anzutake TaxID=1750568 RepID=UPI0019042E3C|nr:uncharacterized protein EI90DRAFT_3089619 [Cantharellus anzutake]KAF8314607.1 hypothetical protein EI90DRAFT_3089619 [Cantharellus anzutake]